MTFNVTIPISETMEKQVKQFRNRLPEALERGLRDLMAEQSGAFQDEAAIIELLTSRPTPEQVLAIKPSPELQARASELLSRSKNGESSSREEAELERMLTLEHFVRMAKAQAYLNRSGKA
jgi:hypothetical protein